MLDLSLNFSLIKCAECNTNLFLFLLFVSFNRPSERLMKALQARLPKSKTVSESSNNSQSEERWMSLDSGATYPVSISSFGGCSSFFIQIVDDSDGWDEMQAMLSNLKVLDPLRTFPVGKLCLVDSKGDLERAKIIRNSRDSTMCFCVDSANLVYFHKEPERIYEIPPKILNFMPFQAINCRLNGINSPIDSNWTSIMYNKIIRRIFQPQIRVLEKLDQNPDMYSYGMDQINSYNVDVFEIDPYGAEVLLSDTLVRSRLADCDHNQKVELNDTA